MQTVNKLALAALLACGCGAGSTAAKTDVDNAATGSADAPHEAPTPDEVFAQNIVTLGEANPTVVTLKATGAAPVAAKELGFKGCMLGDGYVSDHAIPLASVKVTASSKFAFKFAPHTREGLRVVSPDGECMLATQGKDELAPGTYQLWAGATNSGELPVGEYQIALTDRERDLAFDPDIRTITVQPDLPFQAFAGTTRGAGLRPGAVCGTGDATPVFFLDVDLPEWRPLSVLHGTSGVSLYGPLDGKGTVRGIGGEDVSVASTDGRVPCTTLNPTVPTLDVRDGRYAVFLDGEAAGERVIIALGSIHDADPLTMTDELAENPALPDREVGRYLGVIGNLQLGNAHYLFENAPLQLFVYPKAAKKGLTANEPLLLISYGVNESRVRKANGEDLTVRTDVLATEPSGPIQLPELAEPHKYTELFDSHQYDGWEERVLRKRATARWDEFENCVATWRHKHDPTRKLGYDLINIRTAESMRDKKMKEARAVCKFKDALRVEKEVLDEMTKSQAQGYERTKQALETKFR